MKKIMTFVSTLMFTLCASAMTAETEAFSEVKVSVPVRIRLVQGEAYDVSVRSQNEVALEGMRLEVRDGVLHIGGLSSSSADVCVTICSPEEPELVVGRSLEVL